jgi:hypothetical protein
MRLPKLFTVLGMLCFGCKHLLRKPSLGSSGPVIPKYAALPASFIKSNPGNTGI